MNPTVLVRYDRNKPATVLNIEQNRIKSDSNLLKSIYRNTWKEAENIIFENIVLMLNVSIITGHYCK